MASSRWLLALEGQYPLRPLSEAVWTQLGSHFFCLGLGEVLALLVLFAALHEEGQRLMFGGWGARKKGSYLKRVARELKEPTGYQ